MASIFGVFNLWGAHVKTETLTAMNDALAHRIEMAPTSGIFGHVGLGMRKTAKKPIQSTITQDILPLAKPIVVDARLDNFDELCAKLNLDPAESSPEEIIECAFREWGEQCTDHLLGDFAFAIFDPSQSRLFCARDHFGVRPFYYSYTDGVFAFATDPRALLAIDRSPRKLCSNVVLDSLLGHFPNEKDFFVEGIHKLPAAHHLTVNRSAVRTSRYWRLCSDSKLAQIDPGEATDRFRVLFDQAVATRLGQNGETGSFLSGGLDSSAITASAVHLSRARRDSKPLHAFASVFPDVPESDESHWIMRVADFLNRDRDALALHTSGGEESGPMHHAESMTKALGEPILVPNLYFTWHMIAQAAQTDVKVILTGHDGDCVVGHGLYKLTNLAVAERWEEVEVELSALLHMLGGYENARRALVRMYVRPAAGIHFRRLRFIRALRVLERLRRQFGVSTKETIVEDILPFWWRFLRDSFRRNYLRRLHLRDGLRIRWQVFCRRLANARRPESRPEFQHIDSIDMGAVSAIFEWFDKFGAVHGIELRHPFFDKRLVEFCVSLPLDLKNRKGVTRWVLREAMNGQLPEDVRMRRDKQDLTPSFMRRLGKQKILLDRALKLPETDLHPLWDIEAVQNDAREISTTRKAISLPTLYRIACFKLWQSVKEQG